MDNRPIGFFDSGLGGLTCIPHLLRGFPRERVVYFGDTARTPYGSKAPSTILKFAMEIADFLIESQNIKLLAIACNTVSATALEELRKRHPGVPVLGIIKPAARAVAAGCPASGRIGVIGTKATISSGAYEDEIAESAPELKVFGRACPALVPLIEEGIIQNKIMDLAIEYYLGSFLKTNALDTLILGCTHYPLIRANIERLYPGLSIIDPSVEFAPAIGEALERIDGGGDSGDESGHIIYASDLSENFVNMIDNIFTGTGLPVTLELIDLESFPKRKEARNGT